MAHEHAPDVAPIPAEPAPLETEVAVRSQPEVLVALRRGYRWITGTTWLYRLAAAGYGSGTLLAIFALGNPDVPLGAGLLVVALFALMTVFLLVSAIQIHFEPFIWTLVTAILASLVFGVHVVGPNPLGAAHWWSLAWALVFWVATLPTFRMNQLMEAHKDLYVLHHSNAQTQRAIRRRSPEERHERLLRVMRRASQRAWKLSATAAGAVVLTSAVGAWTVVSQVRPQSFSAAVEEFERAWNAGDSAALGALFLPQSREAQEAWLAGVIDGYGWTARPAQLRDARTSQSDDGSWWVGYAVGKVRLTTGWGRPDRKWYVTVLELPPPPLEPVIARLRAAWRHSDFEAIGALYAPKFQERMRESVARSARARGWETLPEIVTTKSQRSLPTEAGAGAADASVILVTAAGELESEWHFRGDGRWRLHALRFP